MKRFLSILSIMLMASLAVCAEEPSKLAPANGAEMPLALYQKLKGHFDDMYGAKAGLLPGVQQRERGEIETSLKSEASANKAILIKALGSSLVIQRELAARALEYSGDKPAAIEALGKAVTTDADESVRRAAAASLAKLPDAAAQDSLIKALGDSVETVRALSARALGNIKDAHASEALLRTVNSDSAAMVRMQAALALKKIKDPFSLDGLKKAMDSERDENVKIAIAGAVRELIGGNDAKTEPIPTGEETVSELAKLAKEMKSLEEKLRSDRHDQAVQVDGANIEKQLATLIEKLDKG